MTATSGRWHRVPTALRYLVLSFSSDHELAEILPQVDKQMARDVRAPEAWPPFLMLPLTQRYERTTRKRIERGVSHLLLIGDAIPFNDFPFRMHKLEKLDIRNSSIPENAFVIEHDTLKSLWFEGHPSFGLASLLLPTLLSLTVRFVSKPNVFVEEFPSWARLACLLPRLEQLRLETPRVASILQPAVKWPSLQKVELCCDGHDPFPDLSECRQLQHASLVQRGSSFGAVSLPPTLTSLHLVGCTLDLSALRTQTSLQKLSLSGVNMKASEERLLPLPKLHSVSVTFLATSHSTSAMRQFEELCRHAAEVSLEAEQTRGALPIILEKMPIFPCAESVRIKPFLVLERWMDDLKSYFPIAKKMMLGLNTLSVERGAPNLPLDTLEYLDCMFDVDQEGRKKSLPPLPKLTCLHICLHVGHGFSDMQFLAKWAPRLQQLSLKIWNVVKLPCFQELRMLRMYGLTATLFYSDIFHSPKLEKAWWSGPFSIESVNELRIARQLLPIKYEEAMSDGK